ncbi:MAG: transketolase [Pelagibacteraceae bacterium TMED65]|nr:MAG: transketolase [Pelagibacteraceae bacterium TMED65]|tara:strand:+ start:9350 stop:10270 length:921 start_codon:yes stop_codon:yes gene_type:complete
MRDTFVKEITKLAEKNKKIVVLAGDIGYKLFDNFIKKFPKRFYNCGVAEANMTTVAAGLAIKGYIPITYTIATFNVYKTVEQIKVDICYPNLGVIIVGVGSGLSYADLGATHHAIEDIGVLRSIPNLNIVAPSDPLELESLVPQIIKKKQPTYLRIGKRGEKNIYKSKPKIKFQKWNQIVKGKKICIISSGNIIINAYEAIKNLNKRKIFPSLISAHTIKPLDKFMLKKIFKQYRFVVTLEEHSKIGGLSSSISEFYIENQYNNKFLTLSTGENFIVKSGKQENALSMLELSSAKIEKRIIKFLKK